jgi:hypothetical protein
MTDWPSEAQLYRRQFAIGPRFLEAFPSWKRVTIGSFCVTVHPDLPICQVSEGEYSVTLLGYILDPDQWQLPDEPIVRRLVSELVNGRLVQALGRLGGRWVLVANTPRETLVFNDAFGMRQVHFTVRSEERWCAAQPGILATTLRLAVDERALGALGHCAHKQFWLPGGRTVYEAVARLAPNHSLELRSGRVERYWPDGPCVAGPLEDAVDACVTVAQGMFRAAHARFRLAQTITAGWDSRLSLAASRAVSSDVFYFSMQYWSRPDDYRDLAVPAALLPTLGLKHHVIRCPDVMEPAFERIYMKNVQPAHYDYGTIAQGMHDHGLTDGLCVKNCVANIIRTSYVLPESSRPASAEDLLNLTWVAPSAFIIDSVDEWCRLTAPRLNGFDMSELFYWEHWLGGWQATSQHEWELVLDAFDPVNCRSLMAQLLSVPRKLRSPDSQLHRKAIERMWPEALFAPVNPKKRFAKIRRIVGSSPVYRKLGKPVVTALRDARARRRRSDTN